MTARAASPVRRVETGGCPRTSTRRERTGIGDGFAKMRAGGIEAEKRGAAALVFFSCMGSSIG